MTTPEIEPPRWEEMNLATLRTACKEVLEFTPKKRTIKGAYQEVLDHLAGEKHDLPYLCGHCNAAIDGEMPRCWACGAEIDDGDEEPEPTEETVQDRAAAAGVKSEGRSAADLEREVEKRESKNRAQNRVDLTGLESQRLNQLLTEAMPDGWRKSVSKQYIAYWDPAGARRLAVFNRGLAIHFTVEEGFLDGLKDVTHLDAEERKRRHFGRVNYLYVGDVAKDALAICKKVFRRYKG